MRLYLTLLISGLCLSISAQVNYTANTLIKPYTGDFRAAMNLGYYPPFLEEQLAVLSAGSKELGVEGIGVKALRPVIPDNFTEVWGFNFRVNTLKQYQTLGIQENTTIVGFPADWHREQTKYGCPNGGEVQSELFSNLYTDIWDGGANGTPYNDNNYYAAYLYKTVQLYKPYVKFWEIWNEPGYDFTGQKGWRQAGDPAGNWWDKNPDPCDYKLRAPIFHFNRILHISYEIIKTLDPDAYVVLSGVGYASFLDAVCRNTENPDGGKVTPQYPLKGGAYFDVVGFHSYPHFDGSVREWNNAKGNFDYFRHSDAAARGIDKVKKEFQDVLLKYNYNGSTYPEKQWIITECNVPRKPFSTEWGSPLVQRNFVMKAYHQCLKSNFIQNHFYKIADDVLDSESTGDFDVMGFYLKPDYGRGYQQDVTEEGIALKTCTDVLFGRVFDAAKTRDMALPNGVQGGAFKGKDGSYAYMVWAETKTDKSEEASATYSFPTSFGNSFSKKEWNYGYTHRANNVNSQSIPLSATPVFFTQAEANPVTNFVDIALFQTVSQATVSTGNTVTFTLKAENKGNLNATDLTVRNVLPEGFSYVTPITGSFNNGVWTIGNLAVGSSVTLAIQAKVNSISKQVSNIALVQSLEQKDENFSNNTATIGVTPVSIPKPTKVDIEMSMSADRTSFTVGEPITYTVTIINQEEVDATNIVADIPLKISNFTFISQFSTRGNYDHNAGTWSIPVLKFREAVTLKVTLRMTNTSPIRHFLQIKSVSQEDIDSTPNNNEQPDEDDQSILSIPNTGNPCYDDDIPPKFVSCPQNFTVIVVGDGAYIHWLTPTAKDRCGNPLLTANYQSGQWFPLGSYAVNYKATDNNALFSNCSFTLVVAKNEINPCEIDKTPPVFTKCPSDITVKTDKNAEVATWIAPTVSDNCSSTPLSANCALTPCVTVSSNFASGSIFPLGTTTVTYTATDAQNNKSSCSFNVIVTKITSLNDVDLGLKITAAPSVFKIYTVVIFTTTVTNSGSIDATNIKIDVPFPTGFVGGGPVKVSHGLYTGYWSNCNGCGLWAIPQLAAGQSATLELPLFALDADMPKTLTAKILSLNQAETNANNNQASVTVTPDNSFAETDNINQFQDKMVTASPNPFRDEIELRTLSTQDREATILIYNSVGALVKSEKTKIIKGFNPIKVNGLALKDGLYYVHLKMPNMRDRFIKILKIGE